MHFQTMPVDDHIDHVGFIRAIRKGVAYVTLVQTSACASCAVKGSCGVGDSEKKQFEVPVSEGLWHVGDEVVVQLETSTGFFALLIAYLFPFVLVVTALLVFVRVGFSEALAAVIALSLLIPYYALVSLFRKRLSKRLHLKILRR